MFAVVHVPKVQTFIFHEGYKEAAAQKDMEYTYTGRISDDFAGHDDFELADMALIVLLGPAFWLLLVVIIDNINNFSTLYQSYTLVIFFIILKLNVW